jgi:hypothetical protein
LVVLEQDDPADLMATVAGSLHQQAEVEDLLRAAVFSARDTVPGAEEVGISVIYRNGQFHTVAATAPTVYQVDDLQYRFNEGPCIDALRGRWPAASNQLALDSRWPEAHSGASALGIASQVGLRLFDEIGSVAALNLYSSVPNAFDSESIHLANLFAVQAAHVLGRTTSNDQLSDALSTRKVIGHAVGIVMERYRLDEQRAFAFLIRSSQQRDTRLEIIANDIVSDVERGADAAAPGDAA